MWFAAKEAVEKKAMEKGRQEERARISKALERQGITITPEMARILDGEPALPRLSRPYRRRFRRGSNGR